MKSSRSRSNKRFRKSNKRNKHSQNKRSRNRRNRMRKQKGGNCGCGNTMHG